MGSVVGPGPATILLAPRPPTLGSETRLGGGAAGAGGAPWPVDVQTVGETVEQPFERELPVAGLGARVGGRGAHDRAESLEQARPLTRTERRRRRDREPHLYPRVRRVGVLTARPAGAGGAPFELVGADDARGRDPQQAAGPNTVARHAPVRYRPVDVDRRRLGGRTVKVRASQRQALRAVVLAVVVLTV